jgi:hypothetical protein
MRQRALIHIDGPSGAGKTALVEALLAHADDMISVARCVRDDGLAAARESLDDPAGEASELSRYRAAGAHAAVRYSFPGGNDDAFFNSNLMQDFSHAVVMEGDRPVNVADLTVFVVPATAGRLLVRRKSDQERRDRQALDAMTVVLGQPGGMEAVLGHLLGPGLGALVGKHPTPARRRPWHASAGSSDQSADVPLTGRASTVANRANRARPTATTMNSSEEPLPGNGGGS